jgi:hypothetical protein
MPGSFSSPLARLVLFMFCLSAAGSILAAAHYVVIDLPQQQAALKAPTNSDCYDCPHYLSVDSCRKECSYKYPNFEANFFERIGFIICIDWCDNNIGGPEYTECVHSC